MKKATINKLISKVNEHVTLQGWVSNIRFSKANIFIVLRDGSGFVQCVLSQNDLGEEKFEAARALTLESSLCISGQVVADERQIGGVELVCTDFHIYQIAKEFPINKSDHGVKHLADNRHLWLRVPRQWAIMRVRNAIIMAIHKFFQDRGFVQMDSPLLSSSTSEGTSDLFETDFFGTPAYLSQSGQLYAEATAMAMGKVYTFGPTFRAEKSNTPRHLSEFWMIEPEMAFYDLDMNMDLIEEFIRYVVTEVVKTSATELEIIGRDLEALKNVEEPFPRITYTEAVSILRGEKEINGKNAIKIQEKALESANEQIVIIKAEIKERETFLKQSGVKKGERKFNEAKILSLRKHLADAEERVRNIPGWIESAKNFVRGNDFGNSDETVLTKVFDAPVMVYNWPSKIKAFYMKEVDGDSNFVKGVDLLAPDGYGEIVGGSQREDDIEILVRKIKEHELPMEPFEWFVDLRRYGSVPHAGFGLGLERMVRWICGLEHVRETIPFPRRYGRLFP